MTDRSLGDSELDAAIDRAVRDLMGAEPRADLRERVLSELPRPSELAGTSARATLWPRFAFGLVAAAAVLVIAVQFADRPSERPAEQTIAVLPAPPDRPRTAGTPFTRPPEHTPIPRAAPARRTGPVPTTPLRGVVPDDRPIQAASIETAPPLGIAPMTPVARLNRIEPIGLSRLEASEIPAPAIDIKPLAIDLLEIGPLTPQTLSGFSRRAHGKTNVCNRPGHRTAGRHRLRAAGSGRSRGKAGKTSADDLPPRKDCRSTSKWN